MKVSVILPAFNEEKLIPRSLAAVSAARAAFHDIGWASEVIVCDNNSSDRTADLARENGARVVSEPVNQISRARNTGASVASGDWLLFVDADSFPSMELFRAVASRMQRGDCIGGGALVRLEHARGWTLWLTGLWNVISRARGWMAGSFIFCEANVFRSLGGFSTELFAGEEIEFSRRLKQAGRPQGRGIEIIANPVLLTSGRKTELYSARELMALLLGTLVRRGRNLRERSACRYWYDGRR